jgi:hypothetical protein
LLEIEALQTGRLVHEQNACAALQKQGLSPVEQIQASTLLSLTATPYVIDPTILKPQIDALLAAKTLRDVDRAKAGLLTTVEADHQRVFIDSIVISCRQAALEIGLPRVHVERTAGQPARIIAADTAGRTIISEIRANARGRVSLASEVVGVRDSSCETLLERYDAALDRLGVRAEQRQRKTTGGACELEFAHAFLRRKFARASRTEKSPATAARASSGARRRKLLNAVARQRRG